MKKLVKCLLIASAVTASAASLAAETSPTALHKTQNSKNHISLLFLQHASKISFTPASDSCYNVTLSGLSDEIIYFSDEPARVVGKTSAQEFITVWQHEKIKPNAAIHGYLSTSRSSKTVDEVLTFSAPSYDAKKNIMRYTACPTQEKTHSLVAKNLYNATIFYDDFCYFCGG